MIDLGAATEDDVVLAFLKAEIDSARFGSAYATILANAGLDRRLIDHPDRSSPQANSIRRELLRLVRGFGSSQFLFTGFPTDVTWRRIAMEPTDLSKLKYANCPPWTELSKHTRFVTEGAKSIATSNAFEEAAVNIRAVVSDLKRGKRNPELIGVDDQTGDIILMEGHTRATAYAVTQLPERIECLIGSSPNMKTWAFY
jgi:hypothetical protein